MERGWATASRLDVGQVRREVLYFRSGRLVAACRDGVHSVPGSDGDRWSLAGIRFGAAVATLAAGALSSPALVLVEPTLDPATYFAEIERTGRQVRMGAPVPEGWAFAHPLPDGIRDQQSGATVASALRAFAGCAVVIRHQKPARPAPGGTAVRTVPGSWQRGPFADHQPLLVTARRWLRPVARAASLR